MNRLLYFLRTNLRNVFRNRLVYLPTFCLMTAGLTLLYIFVTGFFSYYLNMQNTLRNSTLKEVTITSNWGLKYGSEVGADMGSKILNNRRSANSYTEKERDPLTRTDLRKIEELFGDELEFKASISLGYGVSKLMFNQVAVSRVFMDYFREKLHYDGDLFVASSERIEVIKQGAQKDCEITFNEFPYVYDPVADKFFTLDGQREVRAFASDELDMSDFDGIFSHKDYVGGYSQKDFDEYVFIALEDYFDVLLEGRFNDLRMRVSAKNPEDLGALLLYLNTAHKGAVNYSYDPTVDMLLRQISEHVLQFSILTPLLIIMTLIVAISFMGMQYLNTKRSQRNLAVQIACGARLSQLTGGILLSSLVTVTAAAALAVLAGSIVVMQMKLTLNEVAVAPNLSSVLVILGYGWLLGILACSPSIFTIRKLSPVEILSAEDAT